MSITVTYQELNEAYTALRKINNEVKLDGKTAGRVATMLRKMKGHVRDFEEASMKLMRDVGGAMVGGSQMRVEPLEKGKDESDADFAARVSERQSKLVTMYEEMSKLSRDEVTIEWDPLPRSFFEDASDVPDEKKKKYSANDLADAASFITEE